MASHRRIPVIIAILCVVVAFILGVCINYSIADAVLLCTSLCLTTLKLVAIGMVQPGAAVALYGLASITQHEHQIPVQSEHEPHVSVPVLKLALGCRIDAQQRYRRPFAPREGCRCECEGRSLLEKGADVNAQGRKYGSALDAARYHSPGEDFIPPWARHKGHERTVKLLLEHGAVDEDEIGHDSGASSSED
ncbi:hypothetical protein FIBSPDRAFT_960709 [Athelia psychrophila]|uniref:Ankyrin n=1 Tax=Athelia psychrophila TaxID=1759441 RepID=A0A166C501_9AGAM|nr:hypothetical protein FIBSPDRAFT_960709 [Fibularhizoctonia sp. CBS 109695]